MRARSGELVATDESTIIAKPFLDAIVMEDGQRDGCLANPSSTDESNGFQIFCQTGDVLDQLFASETGPRWWGR